jgi:hypothetical protein
VLTDDRELIKLCKLEEIPFVCAMAIIMKMYEDNVLGKEQAVEKIKKLSEIGRYSQELVDYFIHEVH